MPTCYIAPIDQYVIEKIAAWRKQAGVSQTALAKALGVNPSFVGNVESSKCRTFYNIHHLARFSQVYGVSLHSLLPAYAPKGKKLIIKKGAHGTLHLTTETSPRQA